MPASNSSSRLHSISRILKRHRSENLSPTAKKEIKSLPILAELPDLASILSQYPSRYFPEWTFRKISNPSRRASPPPARALSVIPRLSCSLQSQNPSLPMWSPKPLRSEEHMSELQPHS